MVSEPRRALILGGTAEGRALAAAAVAAELPVISSLAGRVSNPARPAGEVRIGGFGGVSGLTEYLVTQRISAVVDATHPFAATISASAARACSDTGLPLLRLARPGWSTRPEAGGWHWVGSTTAAAQAAFGLGDKAFLTTGRQSLEDFIQALAGRETLIRVVEPPVINLPPAWELIQDRGPYAPAAELQLMASRAVNVLVTKDSGGHYTEAKLNAAAVLGIPVVVVRRPAAARGVPVVDSPDDALAWLKTAI